ncbi:MAG: peroxiredoxin [Hyphomicrobium sp.]
MTIKVGDRLPAAKFMTMGPEGPVAKTTDELFKGKKVALFAVPGAFTPTCHKAHLPGFVDRVDELKAKGVDTVACAAVNDVFVMDEWAKATGSDGKILMLTDDGASFTKAIGLDIDLSGAGIGLGVRSKRYAMMVEDGVVKVLNVDDSPPVHDKSSAETLCSMIDRSL